MVLHPDAPHHLAAAHGILRTLLESCEDDAETRLTITTPLGNEIPLQNPMERMQRIACGMASVRPFPTTLSEDSFFGLCLAVAGGLFVTEPERFPHLIRFVRGEGIAQ